MKTVLLVSLLIPAALWLGVHASNQPSRPSPPPVASAVEYPSDYRNWAHVKSTLMAPGHKDFADQGGFRHIYANPQAMAGYRNRDFPEGSVIVFDWLKLQGTDNAFAEGERRQLDVMVKDAARFGTTGGWGFQRFVGDSRTERAESPRPQQCFDCHQALAKDSMVLSHYR